jgi:hypothetical protein
MGLAGKPHERSDVRDSIVPQIVPDVTSLVRATLAAEREPIVKTPSAPICTIAIRSLRTECRRMQNKDERRSSAAQQSENPPHRISSYDATSPKLRFGIRNRGIGSHFVTRKSTL